MTIPTERTRAVIAARGFLFALLDPRQTPRVPRAIRRQAARVLRHYPFSFEVDAIALGDGRRYFGFVDRQ